MGWYPYDNWRPYVPVAERRRQATKKLAKMKGKGQEVMPVEIAGRKIATTFWGEAWCKNLEGYSDYDNRLPRGRTYVRNGSVLDLQVEAGRVRAFVCGSDLYRVSIDIKPLASKRWTAIKSQCAGQIGSLVELLQGSISSAVMEVVTRKHEGLFPSPREIELRCSCPDWADMCKHVAAALYGVGARLDREPGLLFTLRGVDPDELVETAVRQPPSGRKPRTGRVLQAEALSSVFGVDIDMGEAPPTRKAAAKKPAAKKAAPKKAAARQAPTKKPGTKKAAAKKAATRKPTAKKKTSPRKPATQKAGQKATQRAGEKATQKASQTASKQTAR